MPTHLVSRIDLDLLYPPFVERVLNTLASCERRGILYVATEGFRTPAQQAKLYFQGRTVAGDIVTDARPGWSVHNYGIGVDVVRDKYRKKGLQPDWTAEAYRTLAQEGERCGLQVNIPKGTDYGHLQIPIRGKLNRDERSVLALLKNALTMEDAWKLLDAMGPW